MEASQSAEVCTPKRKRPNRSQESLKKRRIADRERKRRKRAAQKAQQQGRDSMLAKDRNRKRDRAELETETEKAARLERNRTNKRSRLELETATEKAARLDKVRENLEQRLAAETEEEAVERKSNDKQRKQQKRVERAAVPSIAKAHNAALKRIPGTVAGFRSFRLESIDTFDESKAPMYELLDGTLSHLFCIGKMDQACPHCGALLWRLEMTGKGLHSLCCQQGNSRFHCFRNHRNI